jgi:hypothetical protein
VPLIRIAGIQDALELKMTTRFILNYYLYEINVTLISGRLESVLGTDETIIEGVNVGRFLNDLCECILGYVGKRDLNLIYAVNTVLIAKIM